MSTHDHSGEFSFETPTIFKGLEWVIYGRTVRDPYLWSEPDDTRYGEFVPVDPSDPYGPTRVRFSDSYHGNPDVLPGNLSTEFFRLDRTYGTLGTTALRLPWIEYQQELARSRRAGFLGKAGLERVIQTPVDQAGITIRGGFNGAMAETVDAAVLNWASDAEGAHAVGQLVATNDVLLHGGIVEYIRNLERSGIPRESLLFYVGAFARGNNLIEGGIDKNISWQLGVSGIPPSRYQLSSRDTRTDPLSYSEAAFDRRFGTNSQLIGLASDGRFSLDTREAS